MLIASCSSTLGTCCSDYGLLKTLDVLRRITDVIQIVVPILLIIALTIQLSQMIMNPDEKKEMKKIYNMGIAAVVIFFIPMLVDMTLGMMSDSFQLSSCWNMAKAQASTISTSSHTYINPNKRKSSPVVVNPKNFEKGDEKQIDDPTDPSNPSNPSAPGGVANITVTGSATRQAIVKYALSFVGQRYVWGGSWNGELPYTGTDCSGFVGGVYRHFGHPLPRDTASMWASRNQYFDIVDPSAAQPGDLVLYEGHVAMLTGNGTQIVHAAGRKYGIIVSDDYRRSSSHAIRGIMRVKGVD